MSISETSPPPPMAYKEGQRNQRRWTPAEDAILREGFRQQAAAPTGKGRTVNWNEIAKMIPQRTNKDCRKRYYNKLAGCLKKGPWTLEEDQRLCEFVERYGRSWAVIGQKMKNRSADQCSKRWHHSLDPELERRPWTEEENLCLLQAVATHGTSWKDIRTVHFPTKSANNVKNQYTILARRVSPLQTTEVISVPCCTIDSSAAGSSGSSTAGSSSYVSSPAAGYTDPSPLSHLRNEFPPAPPTPTLEEFECWSPNQTVSFFNMLNDTTDLGAAGAGGYSDWWWSSPGEGADDDYSESGNSQLFSPSHIEPEHMIEFKTEEGGNDMSMELDENQLALLSSFGDSVFVPGDNGRITITIDDAQAGTVVDVMRVLAQSRAKVRFHHG